jgi:hypothetical protein
MLDWNKDGLADGKVEDEDKMLQVRVHRLAAMISNMEVLPLFGPPSSNVLSPASRAKDTFWSILRTSDLVRRLYAVRIPTGSFTTSS